MRRLFPAAFRWGATLLAHAVEGADFNSDWWRWEQRPGRIAGGGTSEIAADHWRRRNDDYALARKLGLNALLLSLSWPRLQPAPGDFDASAIQEYRAALETLQGAGIEPFCILNDVALPAWFAREGAWANEKAVAQFRRYAARMASALGKYCRHWIPLFEPAHQLEMSFHRGLWPGGENRRLAKKSRQIISLAHQAARETIIEAVPEAVTGIALRGVGARPEDPYSPWDLRVARALERRERSDMLDAMAVHCDFIGVSFYGAGAIQFTPLRPGRGFYKNTEPEDTQPDTALLQEVLAEAAAYAKPIYITGNGLSTENDDARCAFLLDQLAALGDAIAAGIPLQGYFHHALLDGFEWEKGYTARYGLVHVDRTTLARTPNPSAYLFKDIAESGGFRPGTLARFCPGWQAPKPLEHAR
jgi:beta-glucosidase